MNVRRYLEIALWIVAAGGAVAVAQGPLTYHITPDHAGQLFFPGMNPPLSLKWSVNLSGMVSYPIIIGDRVFVAAGNNLMALDAETGDVLWSQSTTSGYEVWSGPAYENGLLFAAPGLGQHENGILCAFSPTDGHQVWCTQLPGAYSLAGAPAAFDGIVYVYALGMLYAVRESDGSLLWDAFGLPFGDEINPTATDSGVYLAGFCSASKFQPDSGTTVWSDRWQCDPAPSSTSPAYHGLLWALSTSGPANQGTILNSANGSVVGTFTTEGTPGFWQNSAVYLFTNMLVSYDISTGLPQWLALPDQGDAFICPPIGVNGVMYTATKQGRVYGYLSADGSKVFGKDTGGGTNYCWDDNEPVIGLSAGEGLLLVPVTDQLFAYKFDYFGKWQFVPTKPCRLVDTRQTHNPIQGGTSQNFDVPELGGCNIPSTATAYSLNVTVVPHGTLGYLTVWPTMEAQPTVSLMNSDGRVKANAAIVPAGYNDNISVYASDTTDVILDVNGYFTPAASGTLQFYPMTPCRVVDTRGANGPLGGPRLAAKGTRDFPIESSSCIPSGVNPQAYAFNVTVVPNPTGQPLGYLTVWPAGQAQPTVSTLNNYTATAVANAAVVPAGSGGDIDVYSSDTTDLIVDIDGYFAAPGQGGLSLYPTTPCRALDTRSGNGAFSGELTVNVAGSICSPPSTAQAYLLNATVLPSGPLTYLTLWPDGQQQPNASTLNAWDGAVTSNMAIVPTSNGSIDTYAAGVTQLLLDISGYFAP